jgi:glycosyltransferase involved in cell wall biosynthesis
MDYMVTISSIISIVTVCKNARVGLEKTIQCIVDQNYKEMEHIIRIWRFRAKAVL